MAEDMHVWLQLDCDLIVAPGDRVQGKLRALLTRTQGNTAPLRLHPASSDGVEGWSDDSVLGAPLNRDLPSLLGPSLLPAPRCGQARSWSSQTGAACGMASAVHFLFFKETQGRCHSVFG